MAAENLLNYNSMVVDLLSSDPPAIPFDVTYRIYDSQDQHQGDVSAHKFILSLASPIFRCDFFGFDNSDSKASVIKMEGTTLESFQAVVDFMYKKKVDFELKTVDEIFGIYDLAERYMIPQLMDVLIKQLEAIQVTKDTVMEIVRTAEEFARFDEPYKMLIAKCAKTLNKELKTRESLIDFCSELVNTGDEVNGIKLLSIMKDLAPTICSNCQENICKKGANIVHISQVKIGTVIAINPNKTYPNRNRGETRVVLIKGTTMRVEPGDGVSKYNASCDYPVTDTDNIPLFHFCCTK